MSESAPAPNDQDQPKKTFGKTKAILAAYCIGYALLVFVYLAYLATGARHVTSADFLQEAFPNRKGDDAESLRAAGNVQLPSGYRAAERRLATGVTFDDVDHRGERVAVEGGNRLTMNEAVALGRALIEDARKDDEHKMFVKPFDVYNDNFLTKRDWPYILSFYNLTGFFLLIGLFLWGPLAGYLDGAARKSAQALQAARDAHREADEIRHRYEELLKEVAAKKAQYEANLDHEIRSEHDQILANANRDAADLMAHVQASLTTEIRRAVAEVKDETVREAMRQARLLVERNASAADHEQVVATFIQDVAQQKLG